MSFFGEATPDSWLFSGFPSWFFHNVGSRISPQPRMTWHLDLRIFLPIPLEHPKTTPNTTPTIYVSEFLNHLGGFSRMPGVCSKGMLGSSWNGWCSRCFFSLKLHPNQRLAKLCETCTKTGQELFGGLCGRLQLRCRRCRKKGEKFRMWTGSFSWQKHTEAWYFLLLRFLVRTILWQTIKGE